MTLVLDERIALQARVGEERTRAILNVKHWTVHEEEDCIDTFLEAVKTRASRIIGTPLEELDQHLPEEVSTFFFGSRMPALAKHKQPVVAYGEYITRLQPEPTVAIHAELKVQALPKETVLFSAPHPLGREFLVYKTIPGQDYVALLLAMKWKAFEALGTAHQAYALKGIELVDNGIDNWMYDGEQARRVDLGAAEIVYERTVGGIVFPTSRHLHHRLQPYATLAQTIAFILDREKALFAEQKYNCALEDFKHGLFGEGWPAELRPLQTELETQFEIHGDFLAQAQSLRIPYLALYTEALRQQGGAPQ